eukprot:NODE_1699_length_1327_cov_9.141628_g943_i1.p9 GENE.NODE_1699_length_1327_cov_9.141628_g943_i1~~NODE_1699_length_1327_cov_9.141628_g943_i1.p9  ORF type:complete len:57 (-),score=0.97 NODE_1699_length_1327_cov_9.141628_g943_i1:255-425(-)
MPRYGQKMPQLMHMRGPAGAWRPQLAPSWPKRPGWAPGLRPEKADPSVISDPRGQK